MEIVYLVSMNEEESIYIKADHKKCDFEEKIKTKKEKKVENKENLEYQESHGTTDEEETVNEEAGQFEEILDTLYRV